MPHLAGERLLVSEMLKGALLGWVALCKSHAGRLCRGIGSHRTNKDPQHRRSRLPFGPLQDAMTDAAGSVTGAVGGAARGAADAAAGAASGAAGWAADKARESWFGALATAYANWYATKDKTRQASLGICFPLARYLR